MKMNLTKLLELKYKSINDKTTDASYLIMPEEGTSPYRCYSFELKENNNEHSK